MHRVKKCTAKPAEGKPTPQYTEKNLVYDHRPSEVWFLNYGLLMIKENVQSVHLEFPYRQCGRQISGTQLPSISSEWGC